MSPWPGGSGGQPTVVIFSIIPEGFRGRVTVLLVSTTTIRHYSVQLQSTASEYVPVNLKGNAPGV